MSNETYTIIATRDGRVVATDRTNDPSGVGRRVKHLQIAWAGANITVEVSQPERLPFSSWELEVMAEGVKLWSERESVEDIAINAAQALVRRLRAADANSEPAPADRRG